MNSMIYLSSRCICKRFYRAAHSDFFINTVTITKELFFVQICTSILAENVVLQQLLTQHHIYKTDGVPKKSF